MNGKKIIGMTVILMILAGIAVMQNKSSVRKRPVLQDTTLLDGLDLNIVSEVQVTKSGQKAALSKQNGVWKSDDLHGFPADFTKLAEAIRTTADLKMGNPVRSENLSDEEFGFGSTSLWIELLASGKSVAKLEVGTRRETSDENAWPTQHFVRKNGAPSIYLVDSDFRAFSEIATDWVNRQILDLGAEEILSVKTSQISLQKSGSDWSLDGMIHDVEKLNSLEARRFGSVLRYLNLTAIADPSKSDEDLGLTNAFTYIAKTANGFEYTVTLGGPTDGGRATRITGSYTPPAEPEAPADEASQEVKDAHQKTLAEFNQTCNDHLKKTELLNQTLSKWTYVISDSDATLFEMSREKILSRETEE